MCDKELWIFGYGSLMWHPEFDYAERMVATLSGYSRGFTMRSIHHRGTAAHPGLVLALDAENGAACDGLAFRVTPGTEDATMVHLRERELVSYAYKEMQLPIMLTNGRNVQAVTYVIDRDHVQYTGALMLEDQAQIIAHAVGGRGPNRDYLMNTHANLQELGIEDGDITWLAKRIQTLT